MLFLKYIIIYVIIKRYNVYKNIFIIIHKYDERIKNLMIENIIHNHKKNKHPNLFKDLIYFY